MRELIDAVVTALEQAGISALAALPAGELTLSESPRAAVGLSKAARGATTYLGQDDQGQELYGSSVQAQLYVQVYGPLALGGAACTETADQVCQTLLEGVQGLTVTDVTLGQCRYDGDADCFLTTVTMNAAGYVYAARDEDAGEFTGFCLKGALG